MSRLSKFVGAFEEIEIEGEKFKLYPLSANELHLFNPNLSDKEKIDVGMKVIQKSLKEDNPSEDEIKSMDIKIFKILMDKINKLNGFDENEQTGTAKGKIEQIRSRIKQQQQNRPK